jgi:hypothetical protein
VPLADEPRPLVATAGRTPHGTAARRVAVPEVEPERSVFTQHAMDSRKHVDDRLDVIRPVLFHPELPGHPIVPQPEVGRARDARLYALGRQRGEQLAAVAGEGGDAHGATSIVGTVNTPVSFAIAAVLKSGDKWAARVRYRF